MFTLPGRKNIFLTKMNTGKSRINFHLTTDDGSCGCKGMACDMMPELTNANKFDIVYTCGPAIMMAGIVNIFKESATPLRFPLKIISAAV